MTIDDLISMQLTEPPQVIDDLASLREPPSRLSILGKTKNIDRLADNPIVEALWVGDVIESQFNLTPFTSFSTAYVSPISRSLGWKLKAAKVGPN